MFTWASFENHLKYHANLLKEDQKETQILTTHKIFMKTHIVQQTKL